MKTEKLSSRIRKEQIVEAALQILSDNDVKKLSLTEIATRLNLVPSALYRHFNNKDAIVMAILDHIEENFSKNLGVIRQTKKSKTEQLHDLLLRHGQLISQNHGIPRLIFSDEFVGHKSEQRLRLYALITGYLGELEIIIREGQNQGEIRQDVDPGIAARMFLGIIQPGALLSFMSEGKFDIEDHVSKSWPLFKKMLVDG